MIRQLLIVGSASLCLGVPVVVAVDAPPPLEAPPASPPAPADGTPTTPPNPADQEPADPTGPETPEPTVRPPEDFLIAIDAGHGGADPGAIGRLPAGVKTGLPRRQGGRAIYEKDVNLDVAKRLDTWLRARGYRTVMTRTRDRGAGDRPYRKEKADLARRVRIANQAKADLFISIHSNASAVPGSLRGTETYHFYVASPEARDLARSVQERMIARIGLFNRGVRKAGFYVLRNTTMPAVLVETAFLDQPSEARLLARPEARVAISRSIGEGVEQYRADGGRYVSRDPEQTASEPLRIRYWVHSGIFRKRALAERRVAALEAKGFDVALRRRYSRKLDRTAFFVVAGQFIFRDNAKRKRSQLRAKGLPGIVTSSRPAPRR